MGTMPDVSDFAPEENQAGDPLEALRENYQILGELPRGGQAVIYKAIHKPTKRKVALKVLPSNRLDSPKARRAFEREVDLVSGLSHPNIVRLYDSGITRGQYYFSMEYIHGKPLDVFVASRALDTRDRILLFVKICGAVACAHERGIIHSDLKPANILADDRGEPHILDFGLARAGGALGGAETAVTGNWAGTLCYMSPEQAEGSSDLMTVRSDVYSLGVMLYQLLTGRFPYDVSGATTRVIRAIQLQDPVRPRQFISRFDSDLETILLKCLAKDRSRRYSSAGELQEELQRWLKGLPIEAKCDSPLYLLRKIMSQHKFVASVVLLLAIIVVGFSCVYFQLYHGAKRAEQRAVRLAEQWRDQSNRQLARDTEAAFLDFLEAFQSRRLDQAQKISSFVGNASKEGRAMRFLLDPNSVSAREKDFRLAVAPGPADPNSWFADLTLGEGYLRQGRRQEAAQAYQRSEQALSGRGGLSALQCLVKARLYELARTPSDVGGQGRAESRPGNP